MLQIPVSGKKGKGLLFKIDDEDKNRISRHSWTLSYSGKKKIPYLIASIGYETVRLHRFILKNPKGIIDHIDGDVLNNQKNNLRIVTKTQNNQHAQKRSDNTSGYKGVNFFKPRGTWAARIQANGKRLILGYFHSPEAAAIAYNEAAKKYHGEYAVLNTIVKI